MNRFFDIKPRGLKIDLENNYYSLGWENATGKTYLFKILTQLRQTGEIEFCGITYERDMSIDDIIARLTKRHYDIIFFDRFDLYSNKDLCDVIEELAKTTIVLIDIKDYNLLYGIFPANAFISLEADVMEVK